MVLTKSGIALTATVLVVAAATMAACSSSGGSSAPSTPKTDSSSSTVQTGGNSSSSSGGSSTADLQSIVTAAEAAPTWAGPDSSPPVAKGKKVFVLSFAAAAPALQEFAKGVTAGADALGWGHTVYDAQGNSTRVITGLQQAVTQHYSGVVLLAVDSTQFGPQIATVRKAGLPVFDISNTGPTSSTGLTANVGYQPDAQAKVLAAEIALQSGGHAKVATMSDPEFGIITERVTAFTKYLKQFCPGCSVVADIKWNVTQLLTPAMVSLVTSTLSAHPDIDWIVGPSDDASSSAVQALQQTGKSGAVKVVSYEGQGQELGYIKDNKGMVADVADSAQWMGWEADDAMNRFFAGTTTMDDQITHSDPIRLFVSTNLPAAPTPFWLGDYDYQAKYKQLWNVG